MKARPLKVNMVTLGCSKNTVDSEFLGGRLKEAGCQVVHEQDATSADAVIINTCGFILDAKEESIETILQYSQLRKDGRISNLIVMGCLSQRYRHELMDEIGEVDLFAGVNEEDRIVAHLVPGYQAALGLPPRVRITPAHYAYLKVSEGCDRRCAFCAIPLIRGRHQSRSRDEIRQDALQLLDSGAREILLVAQELTSYGKDIYGKPVLPVLLDELMSLPGDFWLRLHYAYPNGVTTALLDRLARHPRICNYLDVPLQHINDAVLRSMKRGHGSKKLYALMDKVRSDYPELAVRTTFIVGYPGETAAAFEELLSFVETYRFERLGAFAYSHEEGTPAYRLRDNVSEELKAERLSRLMAVQEEISYALNQQHVGKQMRVLVDEHLPDGSFLARTVWDSPEIDNSVQIRPHPGLKVGEFALVQVEAATAFDLEARFIPTFDI